MHGDGPHVRMAAAAGLPQDPYRLLFWCGLFFSVAALNNIFLVMDKLVFSNVDLIVYRYVVALVGLLILLPGLILERE